MIATPPAGGIEVVYISPLKALASDIERNLRVPLAALVAAAHARGLTPSPVTIAVRTGDTPARERSAMRRKPPRILVTTPESFYLVLTSPRGREPLASVRAVIIDEVHALVPTKRGVHLTLSLERLERLTAHPPQRIGLTATVAPLEEAARWLGGRDDTGAERPVTLCDAGQTRATMDLAVICPADPAVVGPRGVWPPIAAEVTRLILAHHSTLVFCNNRRLAERITGMINDAAGKPLALSHHGSVSTERRRTIEEQLKAGQLRAVVATGSLELGIDVGSVDLVVQLQSPKAVARGLQRIGRSGHLVGGTPKGRIIPTFRGDFLEAAAVARGMLAFAVEPVRSPERCLDILAQQIVAEVAAAGNAVTGLRELYAAFRRAHPYRALSWEDMVAVVEMLAGRYKSDALREMRPRIDWDRRRGKLAPLPGSRRMATSRPGAIPDRGLFRVENAENRQRLGELDEEFVFESRVGEAFVLGATSWRITRIMKDRVIVRPAEAGAPARMPFWRGEGLGRTLAVGTQLGELVRELGERLTQGGAPAAIAWAMGAAALDPTAARVVVEHVARQREAAGVAPDDRTVVVEQFQDETGDARVALLSPFGGRVHAAWAILLAAEARRRLGLDIPHVATDDGILFRLPAGAAAERLLGAPRWLHAVDIPALLDDEIQSTPLYAGLFRDAAARSLVIGGGGGKTGRTPLWLARLRAADLSQLLQGHPDFPVAREARREALEDALDVRGLCAVVDAIERGQIAVVPVTRTLPSPFAAQLELGFTVAFLYEADAPRAERRARALAAGPEIAAQLLSPEEMEDLLDPDTVATVEARRQCLAPGERARTPEELAEVLRRLGDLDDTELTARYQGDASAAIAELWRTGRATRHERGPTTRWILDEDTEIWRDLDGGDAAGRSARAEIVRRYAMAHGPFAAGAIAARYRLDVAEVEDILAALAKDGLVALGRFVKGATDPSWCDRRNLAEAHRRTLAVMRDRGAPAKMAQFAAYLVERHRAADVAGAVQLLGGVAVPRETFERDLLWRRVDGYQPALLDAACAAGDVSWWLDGAKIIVAPRADVEIWWTPPADSTLDENEAAVVAALDARGAIFGGELVTAARRPGAAVFRAVWSLAHRGMVTSDAFEALRRAVAYDFDPAEAGLDPSSPLPIRALASRMRRSPWVGRFSRILPSTLTPGERAHRQAIAFLRRYGIVGKAIVDAESGSAPWLDLEGALQDLELRGEVIRGYFVDGLGARTRSLSPTPSTTCARPATRASSRSSTLAIRPAHTARSPPTTSAGCRDSRRPTSSCAAASRSFSSRLSASASRRLPRRLPTSSSPGWPSCAACSRRPRHCAACARSRSTPTATPRPRAPRISFAKPASPATVTAWS